MIGLAGFQATDRIAYCLPQHLQKTHEVLVGTKIGVLYHEPAEVPANTTWNYPLAIVFHRRIGRGNYDANFGPMANIVISMAIS
ncbi:MAG: hypothetical protein ACJA09_003334 [Alcanivorax sp.]|jgi:hypothetical protein